MELTKKIEDKEYNISAFELSLLNKHIFHITCINSQSLEQSLFLFYTSHGSYFLLKYSFTKKNNVEAKNTFIRVA